MNYQLDQTHEQRKGTACVVGIVTLLGVCLVPWSAPSHQIGGKPASVSPPPAVEIVMKDNRYHVRNHKAGHELVLQAGEEVVIILRNHDPIPHEFITPLFTRTEVRFSGDATGIFGREAAGFRLEPGKVLTLQFKVPFSRPFTTMYDVAWCNRHANPQLLQGNEDHELLIVATQATVTS